MSGQAVGGGKVVIDSEWPDRLRRGVYSALQLCSIETDWHAREFDVHHIVAAGLEGALPARRLLARWSISVHSVVNAAIVPRSFHQGRGLHRQEFLHTVNLRLSSAAMFAEAVLPHGGFAAGRLIMLQTVQKIGNELVTRSEDAAAIRLQAALQALVARSAGSSGGGQHPETVSRSVGRSGRPRFLATSGARLGGAALAHSRRPRLQHAAACP